MFKTTDQLARELKSPATQIHSHASAYYDARHRLEVAERHLGDIADGTASDYVRRHADAWLSMAIRATADADAAFEAGRAAYEAERLAA